MIAFSEDIDLAIDYESLGFGGARDPHGDMSRTHREKLLDEMTASCRTYIAGPFVEALREPVGTDQRDQGRADVLGEGDDPARGAPSSVRQAAARQPRSSLLRHGDAGTIPDVRRCRKRSRPPPACGRSQDEVLLLGLGEVRPGRAGTLALLPVDPRIAELRRDYEAMSVMIFGDPPPLEHILHELATLEARINAAT